MGNYFTRKKREYKKRTITENPKKKKKESLSHSQFELSLFPNVLKKLFSVEGTQQKRCFFSPPLKNNNNKHL
jgi:hypothetical protein